MKDKERRVFLKQALSLAGLATLGGVAGLANVVPDTDKENVLAAARRRIFIIEPDEIIDAFLSASRGTLMLYYQLFFPSYITGSEAEKVLSLQESTRQRIKNEQVTRNKNRLRALPAVAAAHAILTADGDQANILREIILSANFKSLDETGEPSREVLEMIWRTMNGVLLRTPYHWQQLEVGEPLIKSAEAICARFLLEIEETLPLLTSAASAWQFLIAYQKALIIRHSAPDLPVVNDAIARIQHVSSSRSAWLQGITKLYNNRFNYGEMLPQSFEVMIARQHYALKSHDREAADFFALLGLEIWHNISRIASGRLSSPYMADMNRANDLLKDILTFYGNYGVTLSAWKLLKNTPAGGLLSPGAIHELDGVFNDYDKHFNCDPFQGKERTAASWLAKLVPFRQLEEHTVSEKTYTRRGLILAFIGSGKSSEQRLSCWRQPALKHLSENPPGHIDPKTASMELEKFLRQYLPVDEPRYVEHFAELDEHFRAELVNKVTVANPTSLNLAGAGVVGIPKKRNQMTTKRPLSRAKAQASANVFILHHYGERLAAGVPKFRTFHNHKAWVATLFFRIKESNIREIGEIVIHAKTGRVIDPITREDLRSRVRALLST